MGDIFKRGQGQEGAKGEAGEEGYDGGGTGGSGGKGGKGGVSSSLLSVVIFVTFVALVQILVTVIVVNRVEANTDKLAKLQALDRLHGREDDAVLAKTQTRITNAIELIRQAEYRLCIRQQTTRVAINLGTLPDEPHMLVYDCRPNLVGGKPTLATSAEIRAYIKQVKSGVAP